MRVVDEVVELFLTGGVADEHERPGANTAVGRHALDRFHVLEENGSPHGGRPSDEDGSKRDAVGGERDAGEVRDGGSQVDVRRERAGDAAPGDLPGSRMISGTRIDCS